MTFTYTNTDLSTDLAKIRLILGDTDSNDQLLQDEEIAYFQSLYTSSNQAVAAAAADAIAAKFSRKVNTSIEGAKVEYSKKAEQYRTLARQLRVNIAMGTTPAVTGISISEMESAKENTDRPNSQIERAMFSNPQGKTRLEIDDR